MSQFMIADPEQIFSPNSANHTTQSLTNVTSHSEWDLLIFL